MRSFSDIISDISPDGFMDHRRLSQSHTYANRAKPLHSKTQHKDVLFINWEHKFVLLANCKLVAEGWKCALSKENEGPVNLGMKFRPHNIKRQLCLITLANASHMAKVWKPSNGDVSIMTSQVEGDAIMIMLAAMRH